MTEQPANGTKNDSEAPAHVVVPVKAVRSAFDQQQGKKPMPEPATLIPESSTGSEVSHAVARDQLRSIVERIERLEEEKKTIADDIKDIYGEAKSNGYDVKVLRKLIAIRKQDQNDRLEQEAILDTYLHALGMAPEPDA